MSTGLNLGIVTPVYNDWQSLEHLIRDLDTVAAAMPSASITVIAVDDGSTLLPPAEYAFHHLAGVEILNLVCNVGHQGAICIGLSEAVQHFHFTHIVVMDADGEDDPAYVKDMWEMQQQNPDSIIVASRTKRSEGILFRTFYVLYRLIFRMFTGHNIDFGNFSMLPVEAARRILHMSETYRHYAASLKKSRLKLAGLSTIRKKRYAGKSTMNFVSLVKHGFMAISVFADVVQTRLFLVFCAFSSVAIVTGIMASVMRLFFTGWATPGWATTVAGISFLIVVQSLTLLTVIIFGDLNKASLFPFIPALHARHYVEKRRRIQPKTAVTVS
ncbi:MAG TPA: glycosyltransferase family 2 protein [Candidatus Methylacidiphilales bacterium]|nr:glycosyltransferase family 2 protein [Candidatus Methylacidiphilales bacterium]